ADDWDAVGFCRNQTLRRPPILLERPAELADYQDSRVLGDALTRFSAMFGDQGKCIYPFHRRKPPRKGNDSALEQRLVWFELLPQRPVLLAAPPARTLVPDAA